MLEQLSAGATSAEQASQRCMATLNDVQRLLNPDSLSHYAIKQPKRASGNQTAKLKTPLSGIATLSPFAKMAFEGTQSSFRYLTPTSPDRQVSPAKDPRTSEKQRGLPTPQSDIKDEVEHDDLGTPSFVQPPSLLHPSAAELRAVVVPTSLTPAQRAEYLHISEVDVMAGAGAPQQTPSRPPKGHTPASLDQKQKSEVDVLKLQALLGKIFDAEDQLQPDTSDQGTGKANATFVLQDSDTGAVPMLQYEAQQELDTHVQKVVVNSRLESIEIEHLTRAQRLCESAVTASESVALRISDDWMDQDVSEWLVKVAAADKAMIAARTLMRIMGAGPHIKELQSEDFLRSILTVLSVVVDTGILPIVEERAMQHEKIRGAKEEPPTNPKFAVAADNRKALQILLRTTTRTLRVLGDFVDKTDVDDVALSSVGYLCKSLIFADNATTDKDSVFGVQNIETTRRCAMDVLTKVYVKYNGQRQFILDDVLTSLEKLPATKQSARQFKLVDAKPIQLVSAVFMRLVQTSATHAGGVDAGRSRRSVDTDEQDEDPDASGDSEDDEDSAARPARSTDQQAGLASIARPLHDAAQTNASYIVSVLITRAVGTTKSGDDPHRKLLDIFTEDFLNVLGSSDWPAAEMLLRTLVLSMINIVENNKSPVPARTMALELLGTIGSGILHCQAAARSIAKAVGADNTVPGRRLASMMSEMEAGEVDPTILLGLEGPYHMVIAYLSAREANDSQILSARGYHAMQWAFQSCGGREGSADSDSTIGTNSAKDLHRVLKTSVLDKELLESGGDYGQLSTAQGRLASMIITLSSKLCKAFPKIFSILLSAMSSEHSTMKSRSLKSVVALLETDPSILDRSSYVLNHIFRCANDASPMVRDSALGLIAKCISLRPALDRAVYERVIERTRDAAIGVRKRALKMLKDIYLRNEGRKMRSAIADAILARIEDAEESVTDIARSTMEEVWFTPFYGLSIDGDHRVQARLQYNKQAALLIQTVEIGDSVLAVLEALIKDLGWRSKTASANVIVCKALVQVLFDGIIDSSEIEGDPSQETILKCLAVFARAGPKLFTAAQIERLEPYTQNLATTDDLEIYRCAVNILRNVLPYQQAMLKPAFLEKMQASLMVSISRLPIKELIEIVPCIWTVNCMLNNIEKLVKLVLSILKPLLALRTADIVVGSPQASKVIKLLGLAGLFGNVCDFESRLSDFKTEFAWFKGGSVAALIAEILCPFTGAKRSEPVRRAALEAVCSVAQAWSQLFQQKDVVGTIELAFKESNPILDDVLLAGLEGFFRQSEVSTGAKDVPELGTGIASGTERLGRTYVASDQDGAATSLAQHFLPHILRLALSSREALVAAKLVASINRQGLVHPKESGPAIVALETCTNEVIATLAFQEHRALSAKHESLFDKEYMRAVQQAFDFQRDVFQDTDGYTGQPPMPKLHLLWEVLKSGKAQVRKRFLANLAHKLDFNLTTLGTECTPAAHLLFVRFSAHNLAFFDYEKVEEILQLQLAMEKMFAGTGTVVAQAIESELLKLGVDDLAPPENEDTKASLAHDNSPCLAPERLRHLASAAQICSLVCETRSFIRRLWNMQKHVGKKAAAKESNRAPTRATNAPALTEAYLKRIGTIMAACESPEAQQEVCSSFIELISVDSEVKVASDEDEGAAAQDGYDTPSESTSRKSPSVPPSGNGKSRKRKAASAQGTPKKRGRPSASRKKSGSMSIHDDEGDWD